MANRICKYLLFFTIGIIPLQSYADLETKTFVTSLKDARTKKPLLDLKKLPMAIAFVGYLKGCPNLQRYMVSLREIKIEFGDELLIVNFDPSARAAENLEESKKNLLDTENIFPFVVDPSAKLNVKLGIITATQVALIETKSFDLSYLGAIDDRITLDYTKPKADHAYLKEAIKQVKLGKEVQLKRTHTFGCALSLDSKYYSRKNDQ